MVEPFNKNLSKLCEGEDLMTRHERPELSVLTPPGQLTPGPASPRYH